MSFPSPAWYRKLSSAFPFTQWDEAAVRHPSNQRRSEEPTLYVAPGHPRLTASSQEGKPDLERRSVSSSSWASRDPVCLQWQMLMLLRGISVRCEHVQPDSLFSEDYPGQSLAEVPVLVDRDGTRIPEKDLASWIEVMGNAPSSSTSPDTYGKAQAIDCLLQGPLEAAVLLELVLRPGLDLNSAQSMPLFSRQLYRALHAAQRSRIKARILSSQQPSPTAKVPGYSTAMYGLLGNVSTSGLLTGFSDAADSAEEKDVPMKSLYISPDQVASIRQDGREALEAIALLAFPQGSEEWVNGSTEPSRLDAMLFAHLHTIMSLPTDERSAAHISSDRLLRDTVVNSQVLSTYVRRIWQRYVRPLEI